MRTRWQYGLSTLLKLVTWFAIICAVGDCGVPLDIVAFSGGVALAVVILGRRRCSPAFTGVLAIGGGGIAAALSSPHIFQLPANVFLGSMAGGLTWIAFGVISPAAACDSDLPQPIGGECRDSTGRRKTLVLGLIVLAAGPLLSIVVFLLTMIGRRAEDARESFVPIIALGAVVGAMVATPFFVTAIMSDDGK